MAVITMHTQTAAEIIKDLDNAQKALLSNYMTNQERNHLAARCGVARTFLECAIAHGEFGKALGPGNEGVSSCKDHT